MLVRGLVASSRVAFASFVRHRSFTHGRGGRARGLVAAQTHRESRDGHERRLQRTLGWSELDWNREPTRDLEALLEGGERNAARHLFNDLLNEGTATSHQLSLMMEIGGWTSIEMQSLISHAEAAGVHLDVACCNALLDQLQYEGRPLERVLAEMQMVGIEPNHSTLLVLERTAAELSRLRTAGLRRRLKAGERRQAWWIFEGLLENRQVDSYQLSVLLAHSCETSEDMWSLMHRVEAAGVSLSVGCYNTLLQRLQLEAKSLEPALAEMRSRGIAPTEYTQSVIDRSADELSRMRTGLLWQWLHQGEADLARRLVEGLMTRGQLDSHQLSTVIAHGDSTSETSWALVERAEAAGFQIDVRTFNALLNRLQHEGQPLEPMLAAMRARRVKPDDETKAVLDRPAEELARMRTTFLVKLLQRGELNAARQLFNDLLEGGVATSYHLSAVMAHGGWSSEEMRALIEEAEGLGVTLTVEPFNVLLTRLQHEGQPVEAVLDTMRSHELEPDERTHEVLDKLAVNVSRMRTADLKSRLERGELDAARLFFDGLLERGKVDQHQLAAMVANNRSSGTEETGLLVERAKAARVGLTPPPKMDQ